MVQTRAPAGRLLAAGKEPQSRDGSGCIGVERFFQSFLCQGADVPPPINSFAEPRRSSDLPTIFEHSRHSMSTPPLAGRPQTFEPNAPLMGRLTDGLEKSSPSTQMQPTILPPTPLRPPPAQAHMFPFPDWAEAARSRPTSLCPSSSAQP